MEEIENVQNVHQEILDLVEDQKNHSHFCLDLPPILTSSHFLQLRLKNCKSKLLIFCCAEIPGKTEDFFETYKPMIIGVRGLRSHPPSPAIKISEFQAEDFFHIFRVSQRSWLDFYNGLCLNHDKTEALVVARIRCVDIEGFVKVLKMNLQTGSVAFSKWPEKWDHFRGSLELNTDTGNDGFSSGEIIFERDKSVYDIPIWTMSTRSNRSRRVLRLEVERELKISDTESRMRRGRFSYGKVDSQAINGSSDGLVYFRFFNLPRKGTCCMWYIDPKRKKLMFELFFEFHQEEYRWWKAVHTPFVWKDDSIFAMRFGPKTILVVNRKWRMAECHRHYEQEYLAHKYFLGMFPSQLKTKLVEALKPEEYFRVVDLGEKFCGVYSKLRGSCYRLDEFEKEEDYFFVCFYEDEALNQPYSFLIYPFRG